MSLNIVKDNIMIFITVCYDIITLTVVDLLSLLLSLCFAFGVEADATVKKAVVGGEAGATTT